MTVAATGEEALICYVDGGCKGNNNCSAVTVAGWGALVRLGPLNWFNQGPAAGDSFGGLSVPSDAPIEFLTPAL